MKIMHICITGPFTDGLSYQENELINQHVGQGHDVTILASTETYNSEKKIISTSPIKSRISCGAVLIRLPYAWGMRGWLASKIRAHKKIYKTLGEIKPEIIIFHGLTAWDLLWINCYIKKNPKVKLFVDCHEDFNNSARTWTSREILHKLFYKPIFKRCVAQINQVLCVTVESLNFALDFYGSPSYKTKLFPLGCTLEAEEAIARRRAEFRTKHGYVDEEIVITQTGKLDHTKKLETTLQAFCANTAQILKLVIAGRMTEEVSAVCLPLINSDPRILYMGWQTPDELRTVLAGADCFLQPFGQTVTTQMAMGYGCVILAQDLPSHRWLVGDNDYLFKDASELPIVFKKVVENQAGLDQLKRVNSAFAATHLDYKQLALQIAK